MEPLKEDEVICSRCSGIGHKEEDRLGVDLFFPCIKCSGFGKLDWVENVTGKESRSLIWGQEPFSDAVLVQDYKSGQPYPFSMEKK